MESVLHAILLRSPLNLFDEFLAECRRWYEQPAHTLVEMRKRDNKKVRGDIFEDFCVLYLKHVRGYRQAWRLEDVPDPILGALGLNRRDMGIDIVCERDGRYTAVQCKYKTHTGYKSKTIVTWKQLSTFYALPDDGPVRLLVYTHVREDSLLLYGFATAAEKEMFALLIGIVGCMQGLQARGSAEDVGRKTITAVVQRVQAPKAGKWTCRILSWQVG